VRLAATGFAVLFLVLSVLSCAVFVQAQQTSPTETQVEAAYLFNFGKFVSWPANAEGRLGSTDSLEICVLGRNPFGTVLDSTVKGEAIAGHPVAARTVENLQEASPCHVLFISSSEAAHVDAILLALRHQPSLTVSDIPRFTERGGMIEFVREEDRIRFKVNVSPLEPAGIRISSELLKVAIKVLGRGGAN
jgi:hypothetical protein